MGKFEVYNQINIEFGIDAKQEEGLIRCKSKIVLVVVPVPVPELQHLADSYLALLYDKKLIP